MEGFNPDQSLLPSVGGSITAMSGGGQEGGLIRKWSSGQVDYQDTTILGLDSTNFVSATYTPILTNLAPSLQTVNFAQYFNDEGKNTNDALKEEVLNTAFTTYLKDMEITIESDNANAITNENIQAVLDSLNLPINIGNVSIRLAQDGLTIQIVIDESSIPSKTNLPEFPPPESPPPESPRPGSPPSEEDSLPKSPPPPIITTNIPVKRGGYDTLEQAAKAAAEAALNAENDTFSVVSSTDSESE